jgi:oligopeptide transport system substrate-binding protein
LKNNLRLSLKNLIHRFPKFFDKSLLDNFNAISVNAPKNFFKQRSLEHIKKIVIFSTILQKKIETNMSSHQFAAHIFSEGQRLCFLAFYTLLEEEQFLNKNFLLKNMQSISPGLEEVTNSYWRAFHRSLPVIFIYMEIMQLRGQQDALKNINPLKHKIKKQMPSLLSIRFPSIFWPFNEEEAYKQAQILQKELNSSGDFPQVAIQLRQQTMYSLEFVVVLVRPASDFPIDRQASGQLNFMLHFFQKMDFPFSSETWCFSLFLPTYNFMEGHTINLLRAREWVSKYIVKLIGPFRDYNGGLFAAQKCTFSDIAKALSEKIQGFSLFAEKIFHALRPLETRLTLSIPDWEHLFQHVSFFFSQPVLSNYHSADQSIWMYQSLNRNELQKQIIWCQQKNIPHAEFQIQNDFFLCILNQKKQAFDFLKKSVNPLPKTGLHFAFLEGRPLSLSPYLTGGDLRCRALSKWLFEGLTRLDENGIPQLAAAFEIHTACEGKRYIFHIRQTSWSNGQRLKASDYEKGWKNILKRKWETNKVDFLFIIKNAKKFYYGQCTIEKVGVRSLDDFILQVDLEEPDAYFLEKLSQPLFFPSLGSAQEPKNFNGPYFVHSHSQNRLELEINPFYWDAKNLFFKNLSIRWDLSLNESVTAFFKKEIDWIGDPFVPLTPAFIRELEKEKRLKQKKVFRPFLLHFVTRHPLLSLSCARKALSMSINRSFICKHIFPFQKPLYSLSPNFNVDDMQENENQAKIFYAQAKCLIEQVPLSLNLLYPKLPKRKELALYLKKRWEKTLGLKIETQSTQWNNFRSLMERKEFQIAISFESNFTSNPFEILPKAGYLETFYDSQRNAQTQLSEQAMQKHATLGNQVDCIPVFSSFLTFAYNEDLQGVIFDAAGCPDFRFSFLER